MTQAQKTAKEKFKKAIEYRNKTGCSLKEAFAHVYGRKVGAVKKAPAKKSSTGKHVDTKSHNVNIKIVSGIGNFYSSFKIKNFEFTINKETDKLGNIYFTISSPGHDNITKVNSDMNQEIVKKRALDLNRFIYNSTNLTQREADEIRKKLNKLFENLLRQVKVLNKSVKKPVTKKVAVKKAPVKKVSKRKVRPTYKVDYQTGFDNRTDRATSQDAKRKALPPGKRISKSGNTYYETRANRTDFSRKAMTGVKKYNWEELDNLRLTRVNNDTNGNPRYVLHFLDVLNNEENSFLPFSKKYEYALKKAKKIGGRKFHNKQFGGGIVFQSYNTDNLKEQIIDLRETTPKIKY